jgi:hypothetical protein
MAAELREKLNGVRARAAFYKDQLRTAPSKGFSDLLRESEAEEEQIATRLQEEVAKSARGAGRAWEELPTLAALVGKGGNEARLKLRPVLRAAVQNMYLLTLRRGSRLLAAVQVYLADSDARRDYLIVYQSAGNRRPGGWRALSLATVAAPGDLDLRKKKDAAALERGLQTLDLNRVIEDADGE